MERVGNELHGTEIQINCRVAEEADVIIRLARKYFSIEITIRPEIERHMSIMYRWGSIEKKPSSREKER